MQLLSSLRITGLLPRIGKTPLNEHFTSENGNRGNTGAVYPADAKGSVVKGLQRREHGAKTGDNGLWVVPQGGNYRKLQTGTLDCKPLGETETNILNRGKHMGSKMCGHREI